MMDDYFDLHSGGGLSHTSDWTLAKLGTSKIYSVCIPQPNMMDDYFDLHSGGGLSHTSDRTLAKLGTSN